MSVIFLRALEQGLARVRMMWDTAPHRGIKAKIDEIDRSLKSMRLG